MSESILVVDDEPDFLQSVRRGLLTAGLTRVTLESDPVTAAQNVRHGNSFDLALLDISMPGMSGMELLDVIKTASPTTECIMITALNEARLAVECLKKGALNYLVKPLTRDDLIRAIQPALERKRLLDILDIKRRTDVPSLKNPEAFKPIITRDEAMMRVLKEAELHAVSNVPVLITGESGTGKELLARAIHNASARAKHPFMAVNMASLTDTLFDAEFFGHTKGAFTNATHQRSGHLEHAHRGTLFLDEIGNLPLELQGKLLRVLQEGEFMRLGTSVARRIDVRFVAATNEDMENLLRQGQFRKDLYYRLNGAWLHIPPLRKRALDIPLLAERFLWDQGMSPLHKVLEASALQALEQYAFPGNVRELKSMIQALVNISQGKRISRAMLPSQVKSHTAPPPLSGATRDPTMQSLAEVEKQHILHVYRATGKNKSQTARTLDIGLNTLRRKLNQYGID